MFLNSTFCGFNTIIVSKNLKKSDNLGDEVWTYGNYATMNCDENGDLKTSSTVLTWVSAEIFGGSACGDWTSSNLSTLGGAAWSSYGVYNVSTGYVPSSCLLTFHLYCMSVDPVASP